MTAAPFCRTLAASLPVDPAALRGAPLCLWGGAGRLGAIWGGAVSGSSPGWPFGAEPPQMLSVSGLGPGALLGALPSRLREPFLAVLPPTPSSLPP